VTDSQGQTESRASRRTRWQEAVWLVASLSVVAALLLLAYAFQITICPLKRFTGVPCPTCGSTRAVFRALHGDFSGAWAMQPLVMTLICVAGSLALAAWLSPRVKRLLAAAWRNPLTWVLAALAVASNWAYVIIHGN
jgi:phosphatidylserine synthase